MMDSPAGAREKERIMDKELTEIIVVLDRSSSMGAVVEETVEGFNTFVKDQQESADGTCLLTLTQFNTEYEIVYSGKPIAKVPPLYFRPAGYTALHDAVGRTINEVGKRLADTPEDKRPGMVVMVIITDGEENSSREFNLEQVKTMIEHQTDKYHWEFIFLGQNIDAFHAGHGLGLSNQNAMHFVGQVSNDPGSHRRAYAVASSALKGKRHKAARGMDVAYSAQDRDSMTRALADDGAMSDLDVVAAGTTGSSTSDSSGA
jgi:hypothetical protein